jgi:hypothetical protein
LLIAAGKSAVAGEQGQRQVEAMAIVTTYGLADDAFTAEVERWSRWWHSGYPDAEAAQV